MQHGIPVRGRESSAQIFYRAINGALDLAETAVDGFVANLKWQGTSNGGVRVF